MEQMEFIIDINRTLLNKIQDSKIANSIEILKLNFTKSSING